MRLLLFIFILFCNFAQLQADGRFMGAHLAWGGSQGSLDFHPVNSHLITSNEGEYNIILNSYGDNEIWLEWKNGKKILYAKIDVPMSTSTRFYIDVKIDQNNQLIITGNKRNGESAITYVNGIASLTDIDKKIYLSEINNHSSVIFDNESKDKIIKNNFSIKSKSEKYTLVFDDKGWVDFNPFSPTQENPLRKMEIWLEIKLDELNIHRILYATIQYEGVINEKGIYEFDLPLQVNIDKPGLLEISSSVPVTHPSGLLQVTE